MPQHRSRLRIAAFCLVAAGLLLAGAEGVGRLVLAFRKVDYAPRWALQHAVVSAVRSLRPGADGIRFERPLALADPELGYRCIPGVHRLAMVHGGKRKEFRVTIGDDGYRVTGNAKADPLKPVVAIHGCSYTWGFLLNDEETYPWKLQALLPEYSVRNLAQNGFGTAHALLQARSMKPAPAVAIVAYAAFHKPRNSPSQEWMRQMVAAGDAFEVSKIAYPWVSLAGGIPVVELKPVGFGTGQGPVGKPPDAGAEEANTIALLRAIAEHYRGRGVRFGIAAFTGTADPVMEALRSDGVPILDLSLGSPDYLPSEYKMRPWDEFHPGPRAASIYAERLAGFVRRLRN